MALHQFPAANYFVIPGEIKCVAKQQVFLDNAVPLPRNILGAGSRLAEFLAGGEHNSNFNQYKKNGGLFKILTQYNLNPVYEALLARNVFHLVVCS